MMTRKQFLESGVALVAAPLGLAACAPADSPGSYEATAQQIWRPTSGAPASEMAIRQELVRLATLAPTSHNTQAWKFHIEPNSIAILPDFARRTPVVDPDDHHLFATLGCALANMEEASLSLGLKSQPQFDAAKNTLLVQLEQAKAKAKAIASPLFTAIPSRQCTRGPYDGTALSMAELKLLELAGTGNGVRVMLFTAKPDIEKLLALIIEGNTAQMQDAAFVKELKQWLRFSDSQAVQTRDGLYSAASGNPSLPPWLGSVMFDIMFKAKSENDKYAEQTRSSAGIAVFVSEVDDKTHWVEAGRCYERFALQATALSIRNAMLNQAVEVPAVRQQTAAFLGLKAGRPDLVVRFGRGGKMPQSLRRSVQSVLV